MAFGWMLHKKIYCVTPEDMAKHTWIVGMSDEVFTTVFKLLRRLEELD